jgi:hypothetical protein
MSTLKEQHAKRDRLRQKALNNIAPPSGSRVACAGSRGCNRYTNYTGSYPTHCPGCGEKLVRIVDISSSPRKPLNASQAEVDIMDELSEGCQNAENGEQLRECVLRALHQSRALATDPFQAAADASVIPAMQGERVVNISRPPRAPHDSGMWTRYYCPDCVKSFDSPFKRTKCHRHGTALENWGQANLL